MFTINVVKDTSAITQYWGVEPSISYNYNLNQVNIVYDISPTNYTSTSITFNNVSSALPQGSIVQLNITDVQSLNVTYELSAVGLTESHTITNETYESQLYDLLLLPLKFANKEVTLNEIKRGFTGIDYLLVPKSAGTWETFDGYDNPLFVTLMSEIFNELADVYIEADTDINSSNKTCVFEWFVNGTYFDEVETIDFTFSYNLKIAYDMLTGLLLGMRVDLSIEGLESDDTMLIVIQSEVERENYTLGEFTLPKGDGINLDEWLSSLFPGFNWWLVPAIGITLSGISIIIRKRKQ